MVDKIVRINYAHWERLKTAAFYRATHIKTIMNEILDGKIDPTTLEKTNGGN